MTHCRQIFRDSKNREKLDIFNQAFYWNARKLVSTIFWDDYGLFKDQFSGKSGANHCTRKKVRANCVRGENCAQQKVWPVFPIRPKGQNATQVVGDDSGRFFLLHELWMKRKYAFLPKLFNNLSDRTLVNVRSVLSDTQVRSSKFRVRLDAFISETVNFLKKIIGTLFVENKQKFCKSHILGDIGQKPHFADFGGHFWPPREG